MTFPRMKDRDVHEEGKRLEALGFEFQRIKANGHLLFEHPKHGAIDLPWSPSDWRWRLNFRTEVARRMGLSKTEVAARLGESVTKHPSRVRKRRRRRDRGGTRPMPFQPKAQPERADPALPLIAQLERGTAEFMREYLQLEADGLTPSEIRQLIARKEAA